MNRRVEKHIEAFKVNMGGILLDQALPAQGLEQIDPFILIHHWKSHYPAGGSPQDSGVGPHPHRGFSPVTFVLEGGVLHQDSRGNISEVHKNGVQWMNSGMGIVHSERPAQSYLDKGGPYEIIQLWINSPANAKMKQPEYIPLTEKEIPKVNISTAGGFIQVVAGKHSGTQGKIKATSPMDVYMVHMKGGEEVVLSSDQTFNTMIYVADGGIQTDGDHRFFTKELIVFDHGGTSVSIKATADSKFLYLSGQALNEKMVSHGPFVMNSQTEIMEAIRDYQIGKMGILVEEFK